MSEDVALSLVGPSSWHEKNTLQEEFGPCIALGGDSSWCETKVLSLEFSTHEGDGRGTQAGYEKTLHCYWWRLFLECFAKGIQCT